MSRLLISFLIISVLSSCSLDNSFVEKHNWKYEEGFYIGDFVSFDGKRLRLDNDTIYKFDTLVAVIVKTDKRYFNLRSTIEIESIQNRKKGFYIEK